MYSFHSKKHSTYRNLQYDMCISYLQYMRYRYSIPANFFLGFFQTLAWDFYSAGIRPISISEEDPIISENVRRYRKTFRRFSTTPLSVTQRIMRCVTSSKGLYNMRVSWPGIEYCCLCQPAQRKHELIFRVVVIAFQVRVNMYCDLCKTRKLRREFPLDTMTEKCDHAPLHCLRVSVKLRKRAKIAGVPSYR